MIHNTMRLIAGPEEIASLTRKSWDALFDAFGFETFHPLEGRGVVMTSLNLRRNEAESRLQVLLTRGFAIAP